MHPIIDKWIDERADEIVEALRESIRIPSVEGEPAPNAPFGVEVRRALDHSLALAQRLGLKTRDMDGYIGLADYGEGDETLGVMVHIDVVPEGDGWNWPAFGGDLVDGRILGRGAMDDKGPAIASLYALAAVKAANIPLKRRVRIMLGCNEESGWGCMDHYKAHEKLPELAFSPDAEYPVVNSEKGIFHGHYKYAFDSRIELDAGTRPNVVPGAATAWVPLPLNRILPILEAYMEKSEYPALAEVDGDGSRISVTGLNAHASTPDNGKNALQALIALLALIPLEGEDARVIALLHDMFKSECHGESLGLDRADESGRLTLNVGVLHWDEHGISDFAVDIRHPISLSTDEVNSALSAPLENAGFEITGTHVQPPHFVDAGSELVVKLLDVYEARFHTRPEPLRIGGGTYARALDNAVAFGCEREGIDNGVHMPNEFISVDKFIEDVKIIADAITALST